DGIRDLTVTGVQTCALPISADPVEDRGLRAADVEPRPDLRERLLGDPAELDDDGAVVHGEPVNHLAGGAAADPVQALDDEGPVRSEERRVGKEWRSRRGADQ